MAKAIRKINDLQNIENPHLTSWIEAHPCCNSQYEMVAMV